MTSAFLLTGLRLPPKEARWVFRGVTEMRESTTFMAILDEGAEIARKQDILRQATKRLGEPGEENVARLNAIAGDLARLSRIPGSRARGDDLGRSPRMRPDQQQATRRYSRVRLGAISRPLWPSIEKARKSGQEGAFSVSVQSCLGEAGRGDCRQTECDHSTIWSILV